MFNFFKRLFKLRGENEVKKTRDPGSPSSELVQAQSKRPPGGTGFENSSNQEALAYLGKMQHKISILAERFASGAVNRQQFEELFAYYQNEIQVVEQVVTATPGSNEWKNAISDGQSMIIRRRTTARMIGFSIYVNQSGIPLKTCGQFSVDPALFVPMMHAYQSATKEIFGAQQRLSQIENGKWLGFIPGQVTTMLALFSLEPSQKQLQKLEELHKIFERANHIMLQQVMIDPDRLVCPQEFFIAHTL